MRVMKLLNSKSIDEQYAELKQLRAKVHALAIKLTEARHRAGPKSTTDSLSQDRVGFTGCRVKRTSRLVASRYGK